MGENLIKRSVVFVVLAYRNIDDLRLFFSRCHRPSDSAVVVVNSHYDAQTEAGMRSVAEENNAHYLDVPNRGYGAGNNVEIRYALDHFEFDQLVIANADIEFREWVMPRRVDLRSTLIAPRIVARHGKEQNPYYAMHNPIAEWLYGIYAKRGSTWAMWGAIILNKLIREIFLFMTRLFSGRDSWRVAAAHGACMAIGVEALGKLGGGNLFDERIFLFCEEVLVSRKARAARIPIRYAPQMVVKHREDGSIDLANIHETRTALYSWRVIYNYEPFGALTNGVGAPPTAAAYPSSKE